MIESSLEIVECAFPQDFSSTKNSSGNCFFEEKRSFLMLKSYNSLGHGQKSLCAALSFLEQQFYFGLSTFASVPLLLKRDENLGLCRIERKNGVAEKADFFCEEHVLVNNFLLGLDLLVKQYKDNFFVRVDKCRRKKVKVHPTTIGIAIQSI